MPTFDAPDADGDVRDLHKLVGTHARALQSLSNIKIMAPGMSGKLTLSDSNATLEFKPHDDDDDDDTVPSGGGDALPEAVVDFIVNGQVQQWKINGQPA